MLGRLASYLMGGTAPEAEDDASCTGNAQPDSRQEDGSIVTCAEDGVVGSLPEATLSQVEVEGEDWILIDRNAEAGLAKAPTATVATAVAGPAPSPGMDESWYVTPPACFTQPGPVHVESSPLEDLLIEHPSMSVYRAAGPKQLNSRKHRPKQSARVKHQQQKLQVIPIGPVPNPIVAPSPAPVVALAPVPEAVTRPKPTPAPAPQPLALVVATTAPVLVPQQPQQQQQVLAPIVARKRRTRITRPSATLQHRQQQQVHQSPRRALGDLQADSLHESDYVIDSFYREAMAQICRREDREMRQRGLRRATQRHHQQQRQRARDADATNGGQMMLQADDVLRRAGLRETRPIRGDENFHIVHVRSAQKALEKYSSQSSKRNCLERGNKVREVSSGKRRCPRRQDRLRLNNSNANNNRKC